jgi:hypothetical protein
VGRRPGRQPPPHRESLERPGFAAEVWEVGPAALAAAGARAAAMRDEPQPVIDAPVLMPDRDARMASLGRNIAERRIAPVQAILRRSA